MRIACLTAILCCSQLLGQAVPPSTRPTGSAKAAYEQAVEASNNAASTWETKQREAFERFEAAASTIDLVKQISTAQAELEEARRSGTPQDRLAASSHFNDLRQQLSAARDKALAADPELASATKAVEQTKAAMVAADQAYAAERAAEEAAAAAAQAQRDANDPIVQAIKRHELAIGMTLEQADAAMVRDYFVGTHPARDKPPHKLMMETEGVQEYEWNFDAYRIWARFKDGKLTAHGRM